MPFGRPVNHFVLIDICSVDLLVACVRIFTYFKGVSFQETHLWEHFQIGRADKIALMTCLKHLNVSGAFVIIGLGQELDLHLNVSGKCPLGCSLQHVLTVLVFWCWVLLLPRLPPWSRSLRLFPWPSILLYGPLDICLDLLPAAPPPSMQKRDAQHMFLQHRGARTECNSEFTTRKILNSSAIICVRMVAILVQKGPRCLPLLSLAFVETFLCVHLSIQQWENTQTNKQGIPKKEEEW